MQRLQFALFQIDRAKALLSEEHLPALRVALLLADNAAEVLLDRWIDSSMESEGLHERVYEAAKKAGVPPDHPDFESLFARPRLKATEKQQIARFFPEKIRYATETKMVVPVALGSVLSHLHRYRNQAHHSGKVRAETLRTSVVILIELCCQLLEQLPPAGAGYSSSEDFRWLESRFGYKPFDLWNESKMARIVAKLRSGLPVHDQDLRETLAENLAQRVDQLLESLDFISVECRITADRGSALREAQTFTLSRIKRFPPYGTVPPKLDAPVTMSQVEAIEGVVARVRSGSDNVAAFAEYATTDAALERVEFLVYELAMEIEAAIQLEIDRARGK